MLREGTSNADVAKKLGRAQSSVSSWASEGRRRGCLPKKKQRGVPRTTRCANPECGAPFTAYHGATFCCSDKCARRCRKLGIALAERDRTDPRELGPAEPPIRLDVEGMKRRALSAARDGVSDPEMRQRFPDWMVEEAIAQATQEGLRTSGWEFLGGLPLGLPA